MTTGVRTHTYLTISTGTHLKHFLAWSQNHKAACKAPYDCSLRFLPRMSFSEDLQIIDRAKMRAYMHTHAFSLSLGSLKDTYTHISLQSSLVCWYLRGSVSSDEELSQE